MNNPYYANNNGNYSFSGAGVYSSGDPILDYVLGIPDTYQQASGSVIQAISHEYYAYAQDSWKVTPNFTLNYGIAWDLEAPYQNHQFEGLGIVCWNPGTQTSNVYPGGPPGLTYSRDPGCNTAGGVTSKYNHFGPRLGFAWSPSSGPTKLLGPEGSHSFVIRGGFGMYWNRDAEEGQLQNLGNPPGFKNSFRGRRFRRQPLLRQPIYGYLDRPGRDKSVSVRLSRGRYAPSIGQAMPNWISAPIRKTIRFPISTTSISTFSVSCLATWSCSWAT